MKNGLLAAILIIAAVVLVIRKGGTQSSGPTVSPFVPLSQRVLRVSYSPESARAFIDDFSNREGAGGEDFERLRSAMRELDEAELLEFVKADDASMKTPDCWRRAAIWERLGELGSDAGLGILLSYDVVLYPETLNLREHAAYAFTGGWTSTMESFEEVQAELFPRFLKLRQLGYSEFERAVGREVAKFDPDKIWPHYSSKSNPAHEFTMAGSDKFLTGYLQALSGNPKVAELISRIRPKPQRTVSSSFSLDGEEIQILETIVSVTHLDSVASPLNRSYDSPRFYSGGFLSAAGSTFHVTNPNEAFNQGLASLLLHDPHEAKRWISDPNSSEDRPTKLLPSGAWRRAAAHDPERLWEYLDDSTLGRERFTISSILAEFAPEMLPDLVSNLPSLDDQGFLLSTAVGNILSTPASDHYPGDFQSPQYTSLEHRRVAIEEAISASSLDASLQEDLRDKLTMAVVLSSQ